MDERPWLKHYEPGLPHTLRPYPECTLLDVMSDTVRQRPEHTALIFKGTRMSYARLEQLTNAFGAALVAQGVKKGDRVALLLPNSPQSIIAQLGVWKAGAIAAPINSLYTPRELEDALNEIGAETVVVLTPFYDKVKSLQARTPVRRVIATNIKEYLPAHLRLLFTLAKEKKEGHRIRLQPGDLWWRDLMRRACGCAPAGRSAGARRPGDSPVQRRHHRHAQGGARHAPRAADVGDAAPRLRAHGAGRLGRYHHPGDAHVPRVRQHGAEHVARRALADGGRPQPARHRRPDRHDPQGAPRRAAWRADAVHRAAQPPEGESRQGGLQVDEGVLCRGGAAAGRDQAPVRGADGRVAARRVRDDRDDAGGGRLPGSRRLQRRLDRHPGAGCGRADRRCRYGEADSAAGRDRRGVHQRAADHGGLLGAPGRNGGR